MKVFLQINPTWPWGGGKNLCADETHVISPEPNIWFTPDDPVKSYLSVGNQGKKTELFICTGFILAAWLSARAYFFQIVVFQIAILGNIILFLTLFFMVYSPQSSDSHLFVRQATC